MKALEVKNLKKVYPSFKLDGVSFSVEEGHITGLIGRNGAGKSTTIKGILRLISADGNVKIFGKDIISEEEAVKQEVGYVGGGFRFYPLKTLFAIKTVYKNFFSEWNENKYQSYLKKFSLSEDKRVRELSEGMKVKFAIALALSHGAKLLIMDEPTSGLDPLSREEFCDVILDLVKSEGVSVLFSTHVTSDLMRIADDIVYISCGRVLADSSLDELLKKYKVAHFSEKEQANNLEVIGFKPVKEGYEGLVKTENLAQYDGVEYSDATIDKIMIHLEKEGGGIC